MTKDLPCFEEPLSSIRDNVNLNKKLEKWQGAPPNKISCYYTDTRMANIIETDDTKCWLRQSKSLCHTELAEVWTGTTSEIVPLYWVKWNVACLMTQQLHSWVISQQRHACTHQKTCTKMFKVVLVLIIPNTQHDRRVKLQCVHVMFMQVCMYASSILWRWTTATHNSIYKSHKQRCEL